MATDNPIGALPAGTILQGKERQYKIERVLGQGSFGITYLATSKVRVGNTVHPIKFAIKEHFVQASCYRGADGCEVQSTPGSKADVKESLEDFITEADRLIKLCQKSKSIVNVNETIHANNTAYYVMEYLEGGNPEPTSEAEAVDIAIQVAEALNVIHQENMLHLDIKPDNVVMKRDDTGRLYPVVIDFGVAKHFSSTGKPTSKLSAKGASDGYAPQEQYTNIDKFTPKYDVYALGALLLYMLTGKNPPRAFYIHPNQQEIKDMIPQSVSSATRQTILGAMQPSAFDRTPDMPSFISDLKGGSGNGGGNTGTKTRKLEGDDNNKPKPQTTKWISIAAVAVLVVCVLAFSLGGRKEQEETADGGMGVQIDTIATEPVVDATVDKPEYPDTTSAPPTPAPTPAPAEPEKLQQQTVQTPAANPLPSKPEPVKPQKQEQQTSYGKLTLDMGTWYGGIKNGKPDGKGTLTFTINTLFENFRVEPGYTCNANYENGRLISGRLYNLNGEKIGTFVK